MIGRLRAFVDWAESFPERRLLWINLGIAFLVLVAHGGALALSISTPTPQAEGIRQFATFSLPIAGLVILSAAAGLISPDRRPESWRCTDYFLPQGLYLDLVGQQHW